VLFVDLVAGRVLAVRPDGKEVWVTPWSGNTTAILDAGTRRLRGTMRLGRSPQHVALKADGRDIWDHVALDGLRA
jgi:DNA-binding beta-propeller fold protein YncE